MKRRRETKRSRDREIGSPPRDGGLDADAVLAALHAAAVPTRLEDLGWRLDLGPDALHALDALVERMEREGTVIRNRRGAICLADKLDLIHGVVHAHPDGYGFLLSDAGGPDAYVGPRQMHKVLHGDRVVAREIGVDRRGRREVSIVDVVERAHRRLVGRLRTERGMHFVEAEDRRLSQSFLVAPGDIGGAGTGQVVVAEIVQQPTGRAHPMARIVEVLGDYGDPGMEIEIALRKHDLPHEFSAAALRGAARYPETLRKTDLRGRVDLRDLPLVTIDGETARDFDDAVYAAPLGKGAGRGRKGTKARHRLVVAIADVSHYVRPRTALDREARERGNSVYFPRRVIPMLPEALSNGLCSLNPGVERLCVACDMIVDAGGRIEEYRFFAAVMRSRARLTYTRVSAHLQGEEGGDEPLGAEIAESLGHLHDVYRVLAKERGRRGAIDFETIETALNFDDRGKIASIVPVVRNEAHRLIEECMLAANVCASDFLARHDHPMLFRIHEGPTPEKLDGLRSFLKDFGLVLGGGDEPQAAEYARLLERVKGRPDAQLLQTALLRSLRQAVYSPDNAGHFGLAYESYTHFTSPIRRYPDLLVHRAIKAVLAGGRYEPGDWAALGTHCSQTERRADEATRDVVNWLKCFYMQDRVGERFEGSISAVTGFGVFVALDDVYVEGLVHISELGNDYFRHDAARHRLVGERTHRRYRLADRMAVRLVRVDLDRMRIDFVPDD